MKRPLSTTSDKQIYCEQQASVDAEFEHDLVCFGMVRILDCTLMFTSRRPDELLAH